MDFKDIDLHLNIKSCCLFEKISGKSFFHISTQEDIWMIIYSMLVVNTGNRITYDSFKLLIENEKLLNRLFLKYSSTMKYLNQFNANTANTESTELTITQLATSLIVKYGVDAHYVMCEMEMWEIEGYFEMAEDKKKEMLTEQRLWTYLDILPHIDGKKISSPQQMLPFVWEEDDIKNKANTDLKEKEDMICRLFAQQNTKENV